MQLVISNKKIPHFQSCIDAEKEQKTYSSIALLELIDLDFNHELVIQIFLNCAECLDTPLPRKIKYEYNKEAIVKEIENLRDQELISAHDLTKLEGFSELNKKSSETLLNEIDK